MAPLELTAAEQELKRELMAHVSELSDKLGERSTTQHWELAGAADYLAGAWEAMGFTIERQGYDVGEVVAQNLEVSVSGAELGRQSIIVGAHYDSVAGSAGADAATGVAALLVLSKMLRERTPQRRLSFVAYALGESPHFAQESMGSLRHARQVAARGDEVLGMISLDSLGRFNAKPGSQQSLPNIDVPLPDTGDFLLLLGTENAKPLQRTLVAACPESSGVELISRTYRGQEPPMLASDDWPYARAGMPTVLVSDTEALRASPPTDRVGELDFTRMARVLTCLANGLEALANAPATAPADE